MSEENASDNEMDNDINQYNQSTSSKTIMNIRTISACNLRRDFFFKGAICPSAKFRLLKAEGTIISEYILPTMKRERNPRWEVNWRLEVDGNECIQILLYDQSTIRKTMQIGYCNIRVSDMISCMEWGIFEEPIHGGGFNCTLKMELGNNENNMNPSQSSNREENIQSELPTGWETREDTNGRILYVNHSNRCTQWNRPDSNDEGRIDYERTNSSARRQYYEERAQIMEETISERDNRNINVNEEVDELDGRMTELFNGGINENNDNEGDDNDEGSLPTGWEMQVAPNGRTFFIDHTNRRTTWDDPRISIEVGTRPLPNGWEQRLSSDGKVFFVDHTRKKTTWQDPRFVDTENINGIDDNSDFKRKVDVFRQRLPRVPLGANKLHLTVHRHTIFDDSFSQVMSKRGEELRRRLWIELLGERALDYGGVSREWCFLLSKHIFNPYYGLFEYSALDQYTLQINPHSQTAVDDHLKCYTFIGRIIGIALYHGKLLDVFFIRPFYKLILGQKITFDDMEMVDSAFYKSLCFVRDNDPRDLDLVFSVDEEGLGEKKSIDLIENGSNIEVNNDNKMKYIDALIEWKFEKRVHQQMEGILRGIFEVVPSHLLRVFNETQLELLMCGLQVIDVSDWRANTLYKGGYNGNHIVIHHFWQCVLSFSNEMRARLVQFVTGTTRIPMTGFSGLHGTTGPQKFTIELWGNENQLPRAHTCFNRIDLPPYSSYNLLRKKLLQSIDNTEYFAGVD